MKDLSIMVDSIKFNYRVGLLIKKGNQVLIECNDILDYSVVPGGRVKLLEDSLNALIREVKEEMHLSFNKKKFKLKGLDIEILSENVFYEII